MVAQANLTAELPWIYWSGKRDSNSRPQPWQGCALPTELFPQMYIFNFTSEEEETRTPTTQLSLPPQSSASTNSATSPICNNFVINAYIRAQNRTRTCTSLLTLVPETSASTIPPPGLEHEKRAENETRTRDPNLGKVVLYQLSYFRIFRFTLKLYCDSYRIQTYNLLIRSQMLYSVELRSRYFKK